MSPNATYAAKVQTQDHPHVAGGLTTTLLLEKKKELQTPGVKSKCVQMCSRFVGLNESLGRHNDRTLAVVRHHARVMNASWDAVMTDAWFLL
jgi:hypothetical protein